MIYSPIYDEWKKGLSKGGLYLDTIYRLIEEPSIRWFENVREIDTSEEFILEASMSPVDAPTRRQFLNDDRGREQMLHSNLKKLILSWPREKIYNHDLEIFEFDGMLQNFYDALEVGVPREKILLVLHTHDDDFIKNKLTELNINFIDKVEKKPPDLINSTLYFLLYLESIFIKYIDLPFGISILGVFQKK